MRKVKRRKVLLIFFTLLVTILCSGIATSGFIYNYLAKFSDNSGEIIKPLENENDEEDINVLIMGVDIGVLEAKNISNNGRTDTILVLNYKPKTEEASIISIPRDTLIKVNNKNTKINAAYSLGGVKYVINCVESILGLKINYYGKVDYTGFRAVIDAIGGVDMHINRNMYYDDPTQNLHINFKKGEVVHLDGKKSEEFFRWRKNNDGTGLVDGDLGRIENQHLFIEKVIEKLASPAIITKVPTILDILPKYVETNMPPKEILKYGTIIPKIDSSKLKFHTIKGDLVDIDGISYVVYNENKNKEILSLLHSS